MQTCIFTNSLRRGGVPVQWVSEDCEDIMEGFITWFMNTIGQYISPEWSVFLVSMIPLIDERGGQEQTEPQD